MQGKPRSVAGSDHSSKGSSKMGSSRTGGSRSRASQAKSEAARRMQEMRTDVENVIHVLDNGVNRTPVQLQYRSNHAMGVGRNNRGESMMTDGGLGSSVFHSSFLMSGDQSSKGLLYSSNRRGSGSTSMESSMQSLSQASFAQESKTSASGAALPGDFSKLLPRQTILNEAKADKKVPFTDAERKAWLQGYTTITLSETPTIFLYSHQDEAVSNENKEDLRATVERNQLYAQLEEASRLDERTRFQEKGTTTFEVPKKSIHAEVHPVEVKDSGPLQVTTWMLKDEFAALGESDDDDDDNKEKEDDEEDEEQEGGDVNEESMTESKASFDDASVRGKEGGATSKSKRWLFADTLLSNLRIMERAVVQNIMEKEQLLYRGIEMDPQCRRTGNKAIKEANPNQEEEEEGGAETTAAKNEALHGAPEVYFSDDDMSLLWCFRSERTEGRKVTVMTWNRKEPDILAVGYGAKVTRAGAPVEGDAKANARGLLCCWSLKNPLAPELVLSLNADAGVSALAFSLEHPSLLAVGNTEGGIVVYDIQHDLATPSITPSSTSGVHTGAVWDLRWVSQGKERGEFLMSISADGRVVQWAVGKSVERLAPDLMHLKRPPNSQIETAFVEGVTEADRSTGRRGEAGVREEILSRQSGGMCFDISPIDNAMYVVGTEEGCVFQCNKSQTESYDVEYQPHAELVYRIRWSPYNPNYFLTCSADWSSRLYRVGQTQRVLTFDCVKQDAVQDVAWSYGNALVFAAATAQGNLEIWSIAESVYPQANIQYADGRRLSCVLFAEQESAVVVVGDEEGDVTVFLLKDASYRRPDLDDDEQMQWMEEVVRKQAV
ncbi:dynein intermediate chain [Angomonas deanei]|nr:dynein intermediate chain [Angomonas deanei]|eukprot:EPY37321.1 dynein intermediate chain [Angomonas deanei]